MKSFLLSCFLTLASLAVHAETLTPEPCSTGVTAFCSSPTSDISLITYNPTFGRVLVYMTNGEVYDSGLYATNVYGLTHLPVYGPPTGNIKYVTAVFYTYVTTVRSGKGTTRVTHWDLLSGSVE